MDSPSSDVSKQRWVKVRRMFLVRGALRWGFIGFVATVYLVSRYEPAFFSWRPFGIVRGVAIFAMWVGLAYRWRLWVWHELQAAELSRKS
jgi:hypothetical protein